MIKSNPPRGFFASAETVRGHRTPKLSPKDGSHPTLRWGLVSGLDTIGQAARSDLSISLFFHVSRMISTQLLLATGEARLKPFAGVQLFTDVRLKS